MPDPKDRLYDLLPVYIRRRDLESGGPLRALLQVIAEQVCTVESDIAQLYQNWFIETCESWAVPYIGDLIGHRPLHEGGRAANPDEGDCGSNPIVSVRRDVANTIHYRRRKGTLALLEVLAREVAGWPARAVEFGRLMAVCQSLNHLRPERGRTIDLRAGDALDLAGSAFDLLPRNVDLRGPYTPGGVGIFVFRLKTYSATRSLAYCASEADDAGEHCFTFSPVGADIALFHQPFPDPDPVRVASEWNLPGPIRRRALSQRIEEGLVIASPVYYGEGQSVAIWAGSKAKSPVPANCVLPADLSGWAFIPPPGRVALDPELGRIAFHPNEIPPQVLVTYHYGFSADLGGGEYACPDSPSDDAVVYRIGGSGREPKRLLRTTLEKWKHEKPANAVIEIGDSSTYEEEESHIHLDEGQSLTVRAAAGARPVIRSIHLSGERGGRLILEGLMIAGRVEVTGDLESLRVRHCTLFPGHHGAGRPAWGILLRNTAARLVVQHSILGPIQIERTQNDEPSAVRVSDSILDAGGGAHAAICEPGGETAWAVLTVKRSTVLGKILAHAIHLAEDSIFVGRVICSTRQSGCMRFCYVPPRSRTPARHNCQPDLAVAGLAQDACAAAEAQISPVFESVRYGDATYCQLSDVCPDEIRRGASDESEMGVFHDLFQPQRGDNLAMRLEEYVPAAFKAVTWFAT